MAYYGAAGTPALGVLGTGSPEEIAAQIQRRARSFSAYGEPVQPAMELIASIAQRTPGRDGSYSRLEPPAVLTRYLRVAHQHRMLLILDLQPGRTSFLTQAKALRTSLLDRSVELALDPEWKVDHGAPGGGRIGSSSAAAINSVTNWLAHLVRAARLPDKLVIIHQFTPAMLPDRGKITPHHGIEMVLHADGFGTSHAKTAVLHQLAFPHPPFGVGFKLFLHQDTELMSPAQVMALHPRPDVIIYQ